MVMCAVWSGTVSVGMAPSRKPPGRIRGRAHLVLADTLSGGLLEERARPGADDQSWLEQSSPPGVAESQPLAPGGRLEIGLSADEWVQYEALKLAAEALLDDGEAGRPGPAGVHEDGQDLASFTAGIQSTGVTPVGRDEAEDEVSFLKHLSVAPDRRAGQSRPDRFGSAALDGVASATGRHRGAPRLGRRGRGRVRRRAVMLLLTAALIAGGALVVFRPHTGTGAPPASANGSVSELGDLAGLGGTLTRIDGAAMSLTQKAITEIRARSAAAKRARKLYARAARRRIALRHVRGRRPAETSSADPASPVASAPTQTVTAPQTSSATSAAPSAPTSSHKSTSSSSATSTHHQAFGSTGVLGVGHAG
jgi:hypothetical protein